VDGLHIAQAFLLAIVQLMQLLLDTLVVGRLLSVSVDELGLGLVLPVQ
jgi:hypothetical protein